MVYKNTPCAKTNYRGVRRKSDQNLIKTRKPFDKIGTYNGNLRWQVYHLTYELKGNFNNY